LPFSVPENVSEYFESDALAEPFALFLVRVARACRRGAGDNQRRREGDG
jgi:hypothetical protein